MLSSTSSARLHCEYEYVLKTGTRQRLSRKLYVLTPKNKTEQKRIEREIKKTGTYKANYTIAEQEVSMSPIVETELELGPFILWEHHGLAHARREEDKTSRVGRSATMRPLERSIFL